MVQNNQALLMRLNKHEVEYVVIGGVCAVYYGVPIVTFDLDICCRFNESNLFRIQAAVSDLSPRHRLATNKLPLELTSELCTRLKNLHLQTDLGILDCLSEVSGLGDYEQVLKQSKTEELSYGKVNFLNLDALIKAKEATGRDRDLRALPHLHAIKEKIEKKF